MAASSFGTDYSKWFEDANKPSVYSGAFQGQTKGAPYADPFPNPVNDGQREQNARARAAAAGTDIGSGELDNGVLKNPDRGPEKWMADHWQLVLGSLIASPFAATALGADGGFGAAGGAGGASTGAAATEAGLIPTVSHVPLSAFALAPSSGAAAGGASSMGIGSTLLNFIKSPKNMLDVGSILGGRAQTDASNRGAMLEALLASGALNNQGTAQYENALINKSADDRASATDAWKKVQYGDYVNSPAARSTPMLSPYSKPLAPRLGPDSLAASQALATAARGRLEGGSTIPTPQPRPNVNGAAYGTPGTGEKITNDLSTLASLWGLLRRGAK